MAFPVLALIVVVPLILQVLVYIYNIHFHPLRHHPGPKVCAASAIPLIRQSLKGNAVQWVVELHRQYGEIVRVSPEELSFSSADAWKDIYGHRAAGQKAFAKDPRFYRDPSKQDTVDIVNASDADHGVIRRIFANAFSDRALKKQEPLFITYVDKLVTILRESAAVDPSHCFDMVSMFNFTTFDIMADLTFGEPLNMLDESGYHPWVAAILANFRFGTYLHCIRYFPALESLLLRYIPQSIKDKQELHHSFAHDRVDRRLEKKDARPDIWGLVLRAGSEDDTLTRAQIYAHSNLFMIAGTETTATLLSGLTYYLLSDATIMERLTAELRGAFATENDITIERLQTLKYLHACIEEGLRMYPPISNGLPRLVPIGGAMISGEPVPEGTRVFVTTLGSHMNPKSFKRPDSFVPERWIAGNDEYASDNKQGFQPFSFGPRMCLGKNMAYHEIRLILAKLFYNFDLELCEESRVWNKQKVFLMWDKGPLYCRVRERV